MMQGSLHRKLRLLRAERRLSLRQAAKLTGLAKETVSDLERGRRQPNDVTLAKIADAYGISLQELFDLEGEPQEEPALSGKAEAPEEGTGPATAEEASGVRGEVVTFHGKAPISAGATVQASAKRVQVEELIHEAIVRFERGEHKDVVVREVAEKVIVLR